MLFTIFRYKCTVYRKRYCSFFCEKSDIELDFDAEKLEIHFVQVEPVPNIKSKTGETGYVTGYTIRKEGSLDKALCGNGASYNACEIFRATEALLNYMEAEYMLTNDINSGKILEYWRTIREKTGFSGFATDPLVTINVADMSKETRDFGAIWQTNYGLIRCYIIFVVNVEANYLQKVYVVWICNAGVRLIS